MSIERLINHHPKYLLSSNSKLNGFTSSSNASHNLNGAATSSSSISLQEAQLALNSLISNATTNSATVPLHGNFLKKDKKNIDVHNEIKLRFLNPDDINELKTLCSEWFPVE